MNEIHEHPRIYWKKEANHDETLNFVVCGLNRQSAIRDVDFAGSLEAQTHPFCE